MNEKALFWSSVSRFFYVASHDLKKSLGTRCRPSLSGSHLILYLSLKKECRKMKSLRCLSGALVMGCLLFSISCSSEFPDPRKRVEIEVLDQSTALPGEVSIFFRVQDKANGVPVAGLESDDFVIYEQGPNDDSYSVISASEANSRIVPENQNFVFSTMLVLDLSASVISNNLDQLKESATTFINEFMPSDGSSSTQMGVWWFDGKEELHSLMDFTSDRQRLVGAIESISSGISDDPSTNLYGAVVQSVDIVTELTKSLEDRQILNSSAIVVFTDGTDQANWTSENDAKSSIDYLTSNSKILTIGLGDEIDKEVLKDIGADGFAFAKRPSKLNETFEKIAKHISDVANSYYLFQYCSPKRSGTSINLKLEVDGKADDGKHKGEIETSFDATGFTGC